MQAQATEHAQRGQTLEEQMAAQVKAASQAAAQAAEATARLSSTDAELKVGPPCLLCSWAVSAAAKALNLSAEVLARCPCDARQLFNIGHMSAQPLHICAGRAAEPGGCSAGQCRPASSAGQQCGGDAAAHPLGPWIPGKRHRLLAGHPAGECTMLRCPSCIACAHHTPVFWAKLQQVMTAALADQILSTD